jgi:tetratricopeptide (TPR) repeat protein
MKKRYGLIFLIFTAVGSGFAQTPVSAANFTLALPSHQGQLRWHADGFKVVESSAKPNGREIGFRGADLSGRLNFLAFLFLFPEQAPLDSAKCRDGVIEPEKASNPTLRVARVSVIKRTDGPAVALASYTSRGRDGKTAYMVRGFIATGDICGDLEVYSDTAIAEDSEVQKIFASYNLNSTYVPQFSDSLLYAQVLYQSRMYKAAAPMFEQALTKLTEERADTKTMRRMTIDQAGMAYGMSGDIVKSRALFEAAIEKDPDYPLYYYNLACADAEEKKLAAAETHLQQAFARKANVIPGEAMPDPTKDDSFLPYRDNKEFWKFVESLR